ncbi:unnamed protein product [Adineta ricciae]|uniref:DRBM domain-containing protein n=2 Tax=Adineta ricciae TaxID=249248 RepID=A0A815FZG1_ADIRI|nr:unnamed protein product [Adineta ricciae]
MNVFYSSELFHAAGHNLISHAHLNLLSFSICSQLMSIIDVDDAKNRLQEYCQQRNLPLPIYSLIEKTGPDHSPMFQVEVIVDGMTFIGDRSTKKRVAEKLAASEALDYINKPQSPPKKIVNQQTKDPFTLFQSLNLEDESTEIESMEYD